MELKNQILSINWLIELKLKKNKVSISDKTVRIYRHSHFSYLSLIYCKNRFFMIEYSISIIYMRISEKIALSYLQLINYLVYIVSCCYSA